MATAASPSTMPPTVRPFTPDDPETRSADVVAENVERLRALFPEAFTEGGVDFAVLRQLLGGAVDDGPEKYGLTWHGKRQARQLALTPSTGTLLPRPGESVDWDTTQNLVIEGDNLEVLKLLQKSYAGKVKLIYIDPPYNTGKDFVYPDDYRDSMRNYLALTGQVDGEGRRVGSNTEASGRFHTDWLNMMYPRLKLAKNLLKEDGAIFISIDDHEVQNLRAVADEVFGPENFVATVIWHKMDSPKNSAVHFSEDHDYIVVYAQSADVWRPGALPRTDEMLARYKNPDSDSRGPWLLGDLAARNPYSAGRYPIRTPSGKVIPGPPAGDSIILDFFAGSGTTAHAVMSANQADNGERRFVLVQFPEPTEALAYPTLAHVTRERARRAGAKVRAESPLFTGDVGFRVFHLAPSNIRAWSPTPDDLAGTLLANADHLVPGRTEQDVLFELLLKLGLELTVPIETATVAGKAVHAVGAGALLACLTESITRADAEPLAEGIAALRDQLALAGDPQVVFRDAAFADDVAKTNLAAILEQRGFKRELIRSL